MLEQGSILGIEVRDRLEEIPRRRDLPGSREVHDALGRVDAVADVVAACLDIDRFLDGAEVQSRPQDVRRPLATVRGLRVILGKRQRHVERVFGIGDKRDQGAVARVLDPVVGLAERCEIAAETCRQRGLGDVLLAGRPLREVDQIGEEEARHYRADGRTRRGFDHRTLTITGAKIGAILPGRAGGRTNDKRTRVSLPEPQWEDASVVAPVDSPNPKKSSGKPCP